MGEHWATARWSRMAKGDSFLSSDWCATLEPGRSWLSGWGSGRCGSRSYAAWRSGGTEMGTFVIVANYALAKAALGGDFVFSGHDALMALNNSMTFILLD